MSLFLLLFILSSFLDIAFTRSGLDLGEICSNFPCLYSKGYSSAIIRALKNTGDPDENAFMNILSAKKAGFLSVDAYISPCRGKDPFVQTEQLDANKLFSASFYKESSLNYREFSKFTYVRELFSLNKTRKFRTRNNSEIEDLKEFFALNSSFKEFVINKSIKFITKNNSKLRELFEVYSSVPMNEMFKMVWIYIDSNPAKNCGWGSYSLSSNCEFLKKLVKNLENKGKKVGIYSNKERWTQIFGNEEFCKEFANYPVWYSHLDQDPSFDDWSLIRFGGFTKPAIKQYEKNVNLCECEMNSNFF